MHLWGGCRWWLTCGAGHEPLTIGRDPAGDRVGREGAQGAWGDGGFRDRLCHKYRGVCVEMKEDERKEAKESVVVRVRGGYMSSGGLTAAESTA